MKGGGSGGSNDHGDAGASKNPSSNMSMFEAAKTGDSERVQSLIMDGVDVNKTDEAGESPLMIASQHGHHTVVRWLVLAGARTEDVDRSLKTTALMFACIGGHHKVVRELLGGQAEVDVRFNTDNNRVTPLMFAVQYCGVVRLRKEEPWAKFGATIQELLRGGASVDIRDDKGRTALTFAAELGHPEVTSWLIDAKSDIEAADENGTRPLMFACRGGHAAVAAALLEAGADPRAVTSKGSSPLHFAASAASLSTMKKLLGSGAEINAKTEDGDTPLSVAVSGGSVGAVGFLVKEGAALDVTDKEGRSCLDLAAIMFSLFPEEARQVIMQFLKERGARFCLIDAETVEESHRVAESLGVRLDNTTGKISISSPPHGGEDATQTAGNDEEA